MGGGANRGDNGSYREDLQRRRPPESANAHNPTIRAEPSGEKHLCDRLAAIGRVH
jgi:hypothetical protein